MQTGFKIFFNNPLCVFHIIIDAKQINVLRNLETRIEM